MFQAGGLAAVVKLGPTVRICTLPFESVIAVGGVNVVLGNQPEVRICPSLVHTMPLASFTVPPGAVANVAATGPLTPAVPVFTCTF